MDLSVGEMERVVSKLADSGVFHVVFTGGEPFLNKKALFRGLELAIERGMTVSINSNVTTVTEQDAERLKELGVRIVLTSLMGPNAEIHDEIAQRLGAFEKTLRGIRRLQDAGVPVQVNMVVSQKNKAYVAETARLAKSLGLHHFNSTRAGCPGNCMDFSSMALDLVEFREYLDELRDVGEELQLSVDALESYPLCGMGDMEQYGMFATRRCLAGVTSLTVAANGFVRPCSHLDVEYGNIFKEDLEIIWGRMAPWRDHSLLPEICQSCEALSWCGGGCRMEAKMSNGSFNAPDPYAAPENTPRVLEGLSFIGRKRGVEGVGEMPRLFKLNPRVRLRSEEFGGVMFIGPRLSSYVNQDAFAFLSGLNADGVYEMPSDEEWRNFIGNLCQKEVLIPAERSS